MSKTEIGSEFYVMPIGHGIGNVFPQDAVDYTLTFSGRTSIETVINNIKKIRKVLLPSYCCESMIDPFRKKGIEVSFYDVYYDNGLLVKLNIPEDCDLVMWCNYFGFSIDFPRQQFEEFKKRGGIIIEDITHSFFSRNQFSLCSDYIVASLRKWGSLVSGGYCGSLSRELFYRPINKPSREFLNKKFQAMLLKAQYLVTENENTKNEYLKLFDETNRWLGRHYSGLCIDEESSRVLQFWSTDDMRTVRKSNARCLYEGLTDNPDLEFLFPEENMDCPFFVPIIIKNGKRDLIRKKLIEHEIYCPIHWPRPQAECQSNLYDLELSLVCDQRYTTKNMMRIISVLNAQ